MAPTIGLDCQVIIDGNGYWIEPGTFLVDRPRAGHPESAGLGLPEHNIDFGPAKRTWRFTVIAYQAIKDYAGNFVTTTGQAYRDSLVASYQKLSTNLSFTDPHGVVWSVKFANLVEELVDVRAQPDGELQYALHLELHEAADTTVTLDGNTFTIEAGSFHVARPKAGSGHSAMGGSPEHNIDFGPAKRLFTFSLPLTASQLTSLNTSYAKIATSLSFTDPAGSVFTVRFEDLNVEIAEVRTDASFAYYAHLALYEAGFTTITLDSNTFTIEPGSYAVDRPKAGHAHAAMSGMAEQNVDFGPAKQTFSFILPLTSAQLTLLNASYAKISTALSYSDPAGTAATVKFDNLHVSLGEVRTDGTFAYYAHVVLHETGDKTVIIDGNTFTIEPGTYVVDRPKASHPHSAMDGTPESNIDFGVAKQLFSFVLPLTATQLTSLNTSYAKISTALSFTDPAGSVFTVKFDTLRTQLAEVRADASLVYYAHISLHETGDTTITLDSTAYTIEPGTYVVDHPKAGSAHSAMDGSPESNIDFGVAKKTFHFTLALTATQLGTLNTTYAKLSTNLTFLEPDTTSHSVKFNNLTVQLGEVRADGSLAYYAHVQLHEASDKSVTLDGNTFTIEPGTFQIHHPKAGSAHSAMGGGAEHNIDFGVAKKLFTFSLPLTAAQLALLNTSYAKISTALAFTDPAANNYTVKFDAFTVDLAEVRADASLAYYAHLSLVESNDVSVTIDGTSYTIEPGTFLVDRPKAGHPMSADMTHPEHNVDFGPARRMFLMTLPLTAAKLATLTTSYQKISTTLTFVDPAAGSWSIRFADFKVELAEVRADSSLAYYAHIALHEATDATITLDGTSYWFEPGSYSVGRTRVRSAVFNRNAAAGGFGVGERTIDLGPAKREWHFVVPATPTIFTSLTTSYEKVNTTISFTDANAVVWTVRFDNLDLILGEVTTVPALRYYAHIALREA